MTTDQHVVTLEGPDSAGHWAFRCTCGEDASGYEPRDIQTEAERHGRIAAGSPKPILDADEIRDALTTAGFDINVKAAIEILRDACDGQLLEYAGVRRHIRIVGDKAYVNWMELGARVQLDAEDLMEVSPSGFKALQLICSLAAGRPDGIHLGNILGGFDAGNAAIVHRALMWPLRLRDE